MLSELHKLFKLIWQKKKKCCDCKSWKYFLQCENTAQNTGLSEGENTELY